MRERHPDPSAGQFLLHFAQSEPPIVCGSPITLDAALDRLHAQQADGLAKGIARCPLAVMVAFSRHNVNLGLGSDESFVMIGTEPYDLWYYAKSRKEDRGEEDKMFYGVSQDSYWPASRLIPIADARDAVRYFLEHQQLSPAVKWDR